MWGVCTCGRVRVCMCVRARMLVLWRHCEEREKRERKQLGNPLFEHFVLCASFVY